MAYISLENITVASPCDADWNSMIGDDRAKLCSECNKHVYNLSELTRDEAEALILEKEGKLCVRYYQRLDGTIITGDCPVGLRRIRRQALRVRAAALVALGSLLTWVGFSGCDFSARTMGEPAIDTSRHGVPNLPVVDTSRPTLPKS